MTPDGVQDDQRRAALHQPADVDRMKAVHVLSRDRSRRTPALGVRPHCLGSGDCTRMPSWTLARVQRATTASSSSSDAVAGSRSRSARSPASPADFSLLPTYISDAGSLPDEDDRQPGGRPARAVNAATAGADLRADLVGDRDAVEPSCRHGRQPRPRGVAAIRAVRAPRACRRRESPFPVRD